MKTGPDRGGPGPVGGGQPAGLTRLVDEPASGRPNASAEAWAVDLLRAADPYEVPFGRKQRVRLRLSPPSRSRVPSVLRPVVVWTLVGAVVVACGAASAALGPFRGWPARTYERLVGPRAVPATRLAPRIHRAAPARSTEPSAPVAEARPAVPEVALAAPEPTRALAPAPKRRPAPVAGDEDTKPVMEAMRALRLENNPVRARALLTRYLERHPNGTLADEALAMTIQAALAHRDADAPALAARYLKLHPNGPFRALAENTMAGRER